MSIDDIPYNKVHQKSIHNAYQRTEGLLDQMVYWGARSMEIDLHTEDPLGNNMVSDDWAVYHHRADPKSSVHRLSQVLEMFAGFHRTVPNHEVVTVFLDMVAPLPKGSSAAHSHKRLDGLIEQKLGDAVFTPEQLIEIAPGAKWARTALAARGWPTLGELRGKFIFCLTGKADNYAQTKVQARKRKAFVATYLTAPKDLTIDLDRVFYNVNAKNDLGLLDEIDPESNFVTRAFYADEVQDWAASLAARVNHIATDMVNDVRDEWSCTRNERGFPFARIAGELAGLAANWEDAAEEVAVFELWSRSKNLADRRGKDEFGFAFDRFEGDSCDRTMEYVVSGPHSHIDGDVCGGLVVRADRGHDADAEGQRQPEPGDAFFAVMRRGARRPLEVAYRHNEGGKLVRLQPEFGPVGAFGRDIDLDTVAYLRLTVERAGHRVVAEASHDGEAWRELASVDFDVAMQLQGVGVSSAGERNGVRYLFVPTGASAGTRQPFGCAASIGAKGRPERMTAGWRH